MGEELDDEDDGEEGGGKKKGGKKFIIIILAVLLLLGGGGAAAYFLGLLDPVVEMVLGTEPEVGEDGAPVEPELPPLDPLDIVFIETPEILANLKNDGPRRHYVKMKLNFELERPEDAGNMDMAMPRVLDAITVYLREMSSEDFKGSEGMYRLRQELLLRVNAAASPIRVTDVLVSELIVQ